MTVELRDMTRDMLSEVECLTGCPVEVVEVPFLQTTIYAAFQQIALRQDITIALVRKCEMAVQKRRQASSEGMG